MSDPKVVERLHLAIDDAAAACKDLLDRDHLLERLWDEARTEHSQETFTKTVAASQAPWTEPFATTATTIEAGALHVARRLRSDLAHVTMIPTAQAAISAIPMLLEAAADLADTEAAISLVTYFARQVSGWARMARRDLDEAREGEEPYWTKAPVTHSGSPLVCHLCGANLWLKTAQIRSVDAPPLWCRDCEDVSYPATAWLALLQPDADAPDIGA